MFKRLTALLLCAVMVISTFPVPAFAEEPVEAATLPEETVSVEITPDHSLEAQDLAGLLSEDAAGVEMTSESEEATETLPAEPVCTARSTVS